MVDYLLKHVATFTTLKLMHGEAALFRAVFLGHEPGITVLVPGEADSVRRALAAIAAIDGGWPRRHAEYLISAPVT